MLRKRLILFVLLCLLLGVVGYFVLPPRLSSAIYLRIAYPIVLLHWILLFVFLFKTPWFRFKSMLLPPSSKQVIKFVLFAFVSTFFVSHHELGFKTLGDEGLVASVSQNLHFHRSPEYIWRAYQIDGAFSVIESYPEKRPLAFSVILSVVHDISGYRIENGFYLNLLLGVFLIAMMGWFGQKMAGYKGSLLGMLSVPAVPMISYYAHGCGIDILNLVLLVSVLCLAIQWNHYKDAFSFLAFLVASSLLAISRYESVLFLLPVGGCILLLKWRDKEWDLPWMSFCVLGVIALIPLQQSAFRINEAFWEMDSKPMASSVFGFQYLSDNLSHAFGFLTDFSNTYPNSPVVFIMGFVALLLLIAASPRAFRARSLCSNDIIVFIMGFGMLMHFAVIMLYFYGQLDSPILHRFALPAYGLLMITSIMVLRVVKSQWFQNGWVLLFFCGFLLYSIPTAAAHTYESRYIPSAHAKWVREYVKSHKRTNYLVVDFNPLLWTTLNVSSINFSRANAMIDRILFQLEEGALKDIYLLENYVRNDVGGAFELSSDAPLSDVFETKTLKTEYLSPSHYVKWKRISGVNSCVPVDVDLQKQALGLENQNLEKLYYLNLP